MVQNSVVDDINKVIKLNGLNRHGQPIFRVVFSDDQREYRYGPYTVWQNGIFISEQFGEYYLPKYPYISGKWILERYASPELSYHPNLLTSKEGDYICVYVFQDKDYNYLPPLLKVAEIVIHHLLHPRDPAKAKAEDEYQEIKDDIKEEEGIYIAIKEDYEKTATEAEEILVGYVKEKVEGVVNQPSKLNIKGE